MPTPSQLHARCAIVVGALGLSCAGCALVVTPFDPDSGALPDGGGAFVPGTMPSPCGSGPQVPIDPPGLIVRNLGGPNGTGTDCLSPNDDGSSPEVSLGASFAGGLAYFGQTYNSLWVNTNGNVTFRGALPTYTPAAFPISGQPMIAPWWGDADIRGGGSVCFAQRPGLFFATWLEVGYYNQHFDRRNTFQLILRARPDLGAHAFEAQFRYGRCEWTTGDASGGAGGTGGTPAQVGFDAGDAMHFLALPESRTPRVLEVCRGSNTGRPGVYRFVVTSGEPVAGDGCDGGAAQDASASDAGASDAGASDAPVGGDH